MIRPIGPVSGLALGVLVASLFACMGGGGPEESTGGAGATGGGESTGSSVTSAVAPLGTVTRTLDTARAGAVEFAADGTPASLSVTDAGGITYTLDLPPAALRDRTVITMTPYASVSGTGAPWALVGGVSLLPDGLVFTDPPTLRVAAADGRRLITYRANSDGSGLEFAPYPPGSEAAWIDHFSEAPVGDLTEEAIADAVVKEKARVDQYMIDAKALLGSPNDVPAGPIPKTRVGCDPGRSKAIDAYVLSFGAAENAYNRPILGGLDGIKFASGEPYREAEAFDLLAKLQQRVVDRATKLAVTLQTGPDAGVEEAPAVIAVILAYARNRSMLDGKGAAEDMAFVREWVEQIYVAVRDRVVDDHQYTLLAALVPIAAQSAQLGDGVSSDDALADVRAALKFDVSLKGEFDERAPDGTPIKFAWHLDGKVAADDRFVVRGTGTGSWDSGSFGGSDAELRPGPIEVELTLGLRPCDGKADLAATPWGDETIPLTIHTHGHGDFPKEVAGPDLAGTYVAYTANPAPGPDGQPIPAPPRPAVSFGKGAASSPGVSPTRNGVACEPLPPGVHFPPGVPIPEGICDPSTPAPAPAPAAEPASEGPGIPRRPLPVPLTDGQATATQSFSAVGLTLTATLTHTPSKRKR